MTWAQAPAARSTQPEAGRHGRTATHPRPSRGGWLQGRSTLGSAWPAGWSSTAQAHDVGRCATWPAHGLPLPTHLPTHTRLMHSNRHSSSVRCAQTFTSCASTTRPRLGARLPGIPVTVLGSGGTRVCTRAQPQPHAHTHTRSHAHTRTHVTTAPHRRGAGLGKGS